MEFYAIIIVIILLLAFFFGQGMIEAKRKYIKLQQLLKEEYGKKPERNYSKDELEAIKRQFYRSFDEHSIDDITASDLDLDLIYKRLNYSKSSAGDSYLYYLLRTPQTSEDREKAENKIKFFFDNEKERIALSNYFLKVGRLGKTDLYDCIDCFDNIVRRKISVDIILSLLVFVGVGIIFVQPAFGIIFTVLALIVNIISYYSARGTIEPYIIAFSFINRIVKNSKEITSLNLECLDWEIEEIKKNCSKLHSFSSKAKYLNSTNNGAVGVGNPFELIMDYLKMVFHIDIIAFYKMLDVIKNERDCVEDLFRILGRIECYMNIALYRASLDEWSTPDFDNKQLKIVDAYHPLIENPVKNSISTDKSVLITGSNASGKSTFLRTVALNVLLSQTVNTCLAKEFSGPNYSLFSSMALKDDICGNDSYFMVELKAMRRVLNYAKENPDRKVICFVDEVLRGTNTVERIASSTEILKYLNSINCTCFAATHDGELTFLLENEYDNYHFNEEIKDGDVLFNYKLLEGRATSKNAIKLLEVMGFDKSITDNAFKRANEFVSSGNWI